MKLFNIAFLSVMVVLFACNGGAEKEATAKSFCTDTACMSEPIKVASNEPGKPFVTISFKDCKIDSIHYEKGGMGVIKDITFSEFIPNEIRPTKEAFKVDMIGGKQAWIRFNDCKTGRGYAIKLGFDKGVQETKLTSVLNNFDPKYKVADGLVAYYDNTFIYVQDMATDKVAQQLITDTGITEVIDYNNPHGVVDSVNITKENIYAKVLAGGKTIEHNKPLEFK